MSSADKKIKKVIFYTEDVNGIVYRQDLDAAKCVEDLKDGELDSKNGELFFQNGTKSCYQCTCCKHGNRNA